MFTKDNNLLLVAGVGPTVRPLITHTYRTGSNYTVSPPVTNTDIDFYAYVNLGSNRTNLNNPFVMPTAQAEDRKKEEIEEIKSKILADGWGDCGDSSRYPSNAGYGSSWIAFRRGSYNMMLTWDMSFFIRAAAATELCKALNLKDKNQRIEIHSKVHLNAAANEMKGPTNATAMMVVSVLKGAQQW